MLEAATSSWSLLLLVSVGIPAAAAAAELEAAAGGGAAEAWIVSVTKGTMASVSAAGPTFLEGWWWEESGERQLRAVNFTTYDAATSSWASRHERQTPAHGTLRC